MPAANEWGLRLEDIEDPRCPATGCFSRVTDRVTYHGTPIFTGCQIHADQLFRRLSRALALGEPYVTALSAIRAELGVRVAEQPPGGLAFGESVAKGIRRRKRGY